MDQALAFEVWNDWDKVSYYFILFVAFHAFFEHGKAQLGKSRAKRPEHGSNTLFKFSMCWRPNFLELQRISVDDGAFTSEGDREHIHMYPLCIRAHQLDSPPSWSLCLPKTKYNQIPLRTGSQSLHQVLAADWFVLKTMQRKRGILPLKIKDWIRNIFFLLVIA